MQSIKKASLYAAILAELTILLLNNDNRKSDMDSMLTIHDSKTMHR
jgi:hypothetical protein